MAEQLAKNPYLQLVAILVKQGFRLKGEIWDDLPWDGDMPDEFVEAFAMIYARIESDKLQKFNAF